MALVNFGPQKAFSELSEREVLALAIQNEEEDGRSYLDIAARLGANYPTTAELFTKMAAEESEHRRRLLELFQQRYGDHIPLIRREDIKGFARRRPLWM